MAANSKVLVFDALLILNRMFPVVIEPDPAHQVQGAATRMIIVVADVAHLVEVTVPDVMTIVIGALPVVIMMMIVADTVLHQELEVP